MAAMDSRYMYFGGLEIQQAETIVDDKHIA